MENHTSSSALRAHPAARAALYLAGACAVACSPASPDPDGVLPALRARPATMSCLADLDIPADPARALAMPETLSETGCFVDLPSLAPAPDLVPYRLIAPLWTDGMRKQRFLRIPPGETVGFTATGAWDFPVGTVLIKMFIFDAREAQAGEASSRRPIETRFMVRAADAWHFHTYAWNEDGTEAHLLHDSRTVDLVIGPGEEGEEPESIPYYFPDREACLLCHADVTGVALGPRTAQLHRVVTYDTGPADQIAAMQAIGLLRDLPAGGLPASGRDGAPGLVDPADEGAPLELRARSYLHANCAHCHQPGGWNDSEIYMDMRYDTPLAEARLCGEPIWHTIYQAQGELVIDPGDPGNSNLMQRMSENGPYMMPPLGRVLVDPVGSRVLRAWIEGMDGCP